MFVRREGSAESGIVERRELPRSSLFRLVSEHVPARPLCALSRSRDMLLEERGRVAEEFPVVPVSAIVFGSFSRAEADAHSDIDTVLIRPATTSKTNG
jgi:hypothetical protein